MSEAVTVPNLTMATSTVSEESLARDTHTRTHARAHAHTHTLSLGVVYIKMLKVAYDFKNLRHPGKAK